ncbi:MAG: hypothetical protein ACEPOW_05180 [Bacteroidales bacterium]
MEIHYFSKKQAKTPHSFEPFYMRYNFLWADRSYYNCHLSLCLAIYQELQNMNTNEMIKAINLLDKNDPYAFQKDSKEWRNLLAHLEKFPEEIHEHPTSQSKQNHINDLQKVLIDEGKTLREGLENYINFYIDKYKAGNILNLLSVGKTLNINYSLQDYFEHSSELSILSKIGSTISSPNKMLFLDYKKIESNIPSLIFDEIQSYYNLEKSYNYPLFSLPIIKNITTQELKIIRRNLLSAFSNLKNKLCDFKKEIVSMDYQKDYDFFMQYYNHNFIPEWCNLQGNINNDTILAKYFEINKSQSQSNLTLCITLNILPLKGLIRYFHEMKIIKNNHGDFIRSILPNSYHDDTPIPFLCLTFGTIEWNKDLSP